ncbi:hypothetical protein GCM10020256_73130 [Streptomyces thermocoprophilus]
MSRYGSTRVRLRFFAHWVAAMDTEPAASPNCASIAAWLDGMSPCCHLVPVGGVISKVSVPCTPNSATRLAAWKAPHTYRASAGSVPVSARCRRIRVHMYRSRSSSTRTRCASPGGEAPEEAADEQHDLAVGVVVGVAEGQFDVLVPPLRPVPHLAVAQQMLLQFGEAGPQIADLHSDGVAVQCRLLLGGRRVGVVRAGGAVRVLLPLEDVVGGAVDEDELDAGGVQGVRDGLVLG